MEGIHFGSETPHCDLVDQTTSNYTQGASLDGAKKSVSDFLIKKYADKFDPVFPQSVLGNVTKAY